MVGGSISRRQSKMERRLLNGRKTKRTRKNQTRPRPRKQNKNKTILTLHASLDNVQRMHHQRRYRPGAEAGNRLDDGGREARMFASGHVVVRFCIASRHIVWLRKVDGRVFETHVGEKQTQKSKALCREKPFFFFFKGTYAKKGPWSVWRFSLVR